MCSRNEVGKRTRLHNDRLAQYWGGINRLPCWLLPVPITTIAFRYKSTMHFHAMFFLDDLMVLGVGNSSPHARQERKASLQIAL